ncbi:MAG: N-acetylmuramoyl-L-alanine amidase [Candidatus Zixiibacteriota bacterium]
MLPGSTEARSVDLVFDDGVESVEGWRIDGKDYLSLIDALHALGALTDFDRSAQRVRAEMNGRIWVFWGESEMVSIDGEAASLGDPAMVENGQLAAPVEGFARLLDRFTGMKAYRQGSRIRIENRETTVLGFQITKRSNGLLIELPLSSPAPCEAYVSEGNWINVIVQRARIRTGGISARNPSRAVREIRSVQFDSSAQISIRLRDPVERFLVLGNDVPPRVSLLIGDTLQWAPSAVVTPVPGPFGTPDNPIDVIVIDPAHGGSDHGGIGPRDDTREADITLEIAEQVRKLFRRDREFTVVLTRSDDLPVDDDERAGIANEAGADLFISIHAAAAERLSTRGCQTLFWGRQTGPGAREFAAFEAVSDDDAVLLAVRDDQAALGAERGIPHRQFASSRLAELIQKRLEEETDLPSRGVDQANLDVLAMTGMPGVAVNAGFISHPEDEEMLRKKSFQKKVARAIYEAVWVLREEMSTRR